MRLSLALRCTDCGAETSFHPPAPAPAPDTLVLSDGDILHGKLVNAIDGKVTFHTDSLGDVELDWDKIKELHTSQKFAVLDKSVKLHGKITESQIPAGSLDVAGESMTVHAESGAASPAIPVKNAEYVLGQPTLEGQLLHEPGFFNGWAGTMTAGGTLVFATQSQYTASGSIGLVRAVPAASWLTPRNRTSAAFTGSFGKISEPDTPSVKSEIYHAAAERDQYLSPRLFALGQTAFDHNFSQGMALQSVFGGGIGWTPFKNDKQSLDLKATIQYENQQFINTPGAASTPSQNLIGSTFSANYLAKLKLLTLTQSLAFVPAYNDSKAYSANETNTINLPGLQKTQFLRRHARQLSERSAADHCASHKAKLLPIYIGTDLRLPIEILTRQQRQPGRARRAPRSATREPAQALPSQNLSLAGFHCVQITSTAPKN